ncbi:DegV family protein, partial [Chloroflexota bacterium]
STADIPHELARALNIEIVPVYVKFEDEVYRDGVDISGDGFYHKLATAFVDPFTSPPTPADFVKVYSDCLKDAESIVSIHVSAEISDTYNSAMTAKKLMKGKGQVEVIDSRFTSAGLALTVMAAARLANAGESISNIVEETQRSISQMRLLGLVDTMKYLVAGGRVNRATAAAADIFRIKPLLTFKDGEVVRRGLARTYLRGMDDLCEFVETSANVQDLAVAYSNVRTQAEELKKRLGLVFPEEKILLAQIGAGLGVHIGPGALVVAFR